MANEFIIKRGLIVSGSSQLSGSVTIGDLASASGQILEIGTGGVLQTSGNTLNQNLGTSASPSFGGLTVNGNAVVTGNLDVQGTVTTINTSDLFIKDKLVVIASGSTTTAEADGGGLFISGANASITWDNGNSRMEINKPLDVDGAFTATSLAGTGGSITGLNASNISSGTIADARLPGTISSDITGNAATATTATQVGNSLTPGTYITGTAFNGSAARTFAVDATSTNTASKVVARDGSGNFSAGTITAALSGNATTATTLQTGRTINGVSFNGSANITITANTTNALTIGTGLSGTSFNGSSAVTIAIDSTVATLTGTQTLTNKTLTSPTINTPNFGSNNIVSTGASSNLSGSFSGSFQGDGTGLTGLTADFPVAAGTVTPTLEYFVNNGASNQQVDQSDIGTYMAGDGLTSVNGVLELTNDTISGVALGSNLSNLTVDDSTLQLNSGTTYNGSAAKTISIKNSGVTNAKLANSSITVGSTSISLGSSATTIAGLSSVTSTTFVGALTGNASTATSATTATNANNINIASTTSSDTSTSLVLVANQATGNQSPFIDSGLTYNANTNALTATTFSGALSGNATTATTLQTARTINGVSFNGSANITITANTTNALTVGTGLQLNSGTTFNGSAARTISIDSTVATLTGTQTLTNKTLTSPDITNPTITTPTLEDTVTLNTTGITTDSRILRGETTTTVGTQTVLASGTSSGEAVFFDYVIAKSTTDMRAGTVMAVANGSTLRFAEQATTDIGNTSSVVLQCVQSGGNITLQAVDTIGGFTVRALARTV